MMNPWPINPRDTVFAEVWENVKPGLRTLFQLIPIKPHLDHVISIIQASPHDYTRIMSCLLFISSMLESPDFPIRFNEIMELINNIPTDAPEFIIETCRFLKDVFDHYSDPEMSSNGPKIVLNSMFECLAQFPEIVCNIVEVRGEVYIEMFPSVHLDFRFINNVVVFCREITGVEILAG
ncbi:hypothetical protein RF11_00466 [Thelohanellus kitauei]|uniref:Uncharacterized protein n=1 Tax=Thelohanellus kitauei TaxID=669202 RepID=A0A0C2MJ39_THEKT|nr:hypothetical protein RF11_00466 [Thelohanellus kitauei]